MFSDFVDMSITVALAVLVNSYSFRFFLVTDSSLIHFCHVLHLKLQRGDIDAKVKSKKKKKDYIINNNMLSIIEDFKL